MSEHTFAIHNTDKVRFCYILTKIIVIFVFSWPSVCCTI